MMHQILLLIREQECNWAQSIFLFISFFFLIGERLKGFEGVRAEKFNILSI